MCLGQLEVRSCITSLIVNKFNLASATNSQVHALVSLNKVQYPRGKSASQLKSAFKP